MGYVKRRWTVEHTWVCSACQTTNLGRHIKCQHCGKPKEGEKYDESNAESKPAATDAKALAESKRGANWKCAYCGYEDRGDLPTCNKCGASRYEKDSHTVSATELPRDIVDGLAEGRLSNDQMRLLTGQDPLPERKFGESGGYRDAPPLSWGDRVRERLPAKRRVREALLYGVLPCSVIGLLVWGLVWLLTPWQENVTITSATWSRTTELQQRVTRDGEGWGTPVGAFNADCERRQHGTHDCHPHDCRPHDVEYDCRCHSVSDGESCHTHCSSGSNGFSECEEECSPRSHTECDTCSRTEYDTCYDQCPTYDDWCTYQYYDWPTIRTEHTGGTDENPVAWPALSTDPNASSPQRLARSEAYRVTFRNENDTWHYSPSDEHDFGRFHGHAAWTIEVNHVGSVTPLRGRLP